MTLYFGWRKRVQCLKPGYSHKYGQDKSLIHDCSNKTNRRAVVYFIELIDTLLILDQSENSIQVSPFSKMETKGKVVRGKLRKIIHTDNLKDGDTWTWEFLGSTSIELKSRPTFSHRYRSVVLQFRRNPWKLRIFLQPQVVVQKLSPVFELFSWHSGGSFYLNTTHRPMKLSSIKDKILIFKLIISLSPKVKS